MGLDINATNPIAFTFQIRDKMTADACPEFIEGNPPAPVMRTLVCLGINFTPFLGKELWDTVF